MGKNNIKKKTWSGGFEKDFEMKQGVLHYNFKSRNPSDAIKMSYNNF